MVLYFLNFVSTHSLLTYRNMIDFSVLYLVTLLNSLISSRFVVACLGFSIYTTMSSANRDNFISSFCICVPSHVAAPHYCWAAVKLLIFH